MDVRCQLSIVEHRSRVAGPTDVGAPAALRMAPAAPSARAGQAVTCRQKWRHASARRLRSRWRPMPNTDPPAAAAAPAPIRVATVEDDAASRIALVAALNVSPHTARTFVRRIYAKLQVKSRADAVRVAAHQGLLDGS